MAEPRSGSRAYHSDRREAQAALTRERIVTAAGELFGSDGFAGTTIAAIAARAGVSPQSIYATFGSKAKVARAIVEQMQESADAARWRQRLAEEQDPRRLMVVFAHWTRAFFEASTPQLVAVRDVTEEMADLFDEGNARRREALTTLIGRMADAGVLRDDLGTVDAVDRAWLLTGLDVYVNATRACEWPPQRYADWLAETLTAQLLRPFGDT